MNRLSARVLRVCSAWGSMSGGPSWLGRFTELGSPRCSGAGPGPRHRIEFVDVLTGVAPQAWGRGRWIPGHPQAQVASGLQYPRFPVGCPG